MVEVPGIEPGSEMKATLGATCFSLIDLLVPSDGKGNLLPAPSSINRSGKLRAEAPRRPARKFTDIHNAHAGTL